MVKSSAVNVGVKAFWRTSASSIPILPTILLGTLPKIAPLIESFNWVVNWFAKIKFRRYFRASDKIDSKESVAKFWNSSTNRQKSFRWSSGISARLIAAAWNFITKTIPNSLAACSPIIPLDKLTKRIFWLSITSLMLKAEFFWPIILFISPLSKGAHLDTTQEVISPASLDFWEAGHSLVQKSIALWFLRYFILEIAKSGSTNTLGMSMKVPPLGSLINNIAALRTILSILGPTMPWLFGSYNDLSMELVSEITKSISSFVLASKILNPSGLSISLGLKYITSSRRSLGIIPINSSTESPWGSIKAKPLPSIISW